jgi:signal transduction protein with GAF and PtsI domain
MSVRLTVRWKRGTEPFERSITALLSLILRETGADAACLYAYDADDATLVLRQAEGLAAEKLRCAEMALTSAASGLLLNAFQPLLNIEADFPEALLNGFGSFLVIPLRGSDSLLGLLTIGWKQECVDAELRAHSVMSAGQALASILSKPYSPALNQQLAERVTFLEAELADRKIADRVRGLARSPEVVREHVNRVLESCDLPEQLVQRAEELERQLAGRDLLLQAKEILQASKGLTEEEAYLYLRNRSRRNRVPLEQVAHSVILDRDAVVEA